MSAPITIARALTYTQYRLSWKREGWIRTKHKKYRSMKPVNRMIGLLTSPEPWVVLGLDADEHFCCSGYQCNCLGIKVRDEMVAKREGLPPIEFVKLMKRTVNQTAWVEA